MASFEDASQHFPPTRPFDNHKNKNVSQQPGKLYNNIKLENECYREECPTRL